MGRAAIGVVVLVDAEEEHKVAGVLPVGDRTQLVQVAAVAVRRDVERVAPWREFRQWIIVELSVD